MVFISNEKKDAGFKIAAKIAAALERRGVEYYFDEQIDIDKSKHINGRKLDVLIILGGDGTILSAARKYAESGVLLLGVNMGRLGFLLDTELKDFESAIDSIISGDYEIEERLDAKGLDSE